MYSAFRFKTQSYNLLPFAGAMFFICVLILWNAKECMAAHHPKTTRIPSPLSSCSSIRRFHEERVKPTSKTGNNAFDVLSRRNGSPSLYTQGGQTDDLFLLKGDTFLTLRCVSPEPTERHPRQEANRECPSGTLLSRRQVQSSKSRLQEALRTVPPRHTTKSVVNGEITS